MNRVLIPLTIVLLFLSSCLFKDNSTIILWTDRAEMVAYVEEFNSTQDRFRVEIVYKERPEAALGQTQNPADLIVSEYLNAPHTIDLFLSLTEIFRKEGMDLSGFYPGLLELGRKDDQLILLPVSFNLPTVMFNGVNELTEIPPFYMNTEDMKKAAIIFNESSNDNFQRMGFSPKWNSEVLFQNAVLMGAEFQLLGTGVISWNNDKLRDSIELSESWSKEINGGFVVEEEFTAKFLYDPSYKLIAENRILFYYSDLVGFFDISPERRKDLDFRWMSSNDKISVLGDILFTGIPNGAGNKKGAVEFIRWFFNPVTQKSLLKSSQIKRMDTFGFANGFSSLIEVNNNEVAIIYPSLVGNIPPESSLIFPRPLPNYWQDLKNKVIKPWLVDQTGQYPKDQSLNQAIKEWMKQKPVESVY